MLKFAILGLGGLGKVHFRNYKQVKERKDVKLVAICDIEKSAFETQTDTNLGSDTSVLDFAGINLYNDAEEMFEKEELDFIISAIPTYIHEKYAVMAMDKGIHVFSEKPMAINYEQGKSMLDASKRNNVKLMIGQCCRYDSSYNKLKELVETKEYGRIVDVEFVRLSKTPKWAWNDWYRKEELSGGAILDMHVHDVDIINYMFGRPEKICSIGTNVASKHDSVSTIYFYDDLSVCARVNWGESSSHPFTEYFHARFENASVDFLRDTFMIYPDGKEAFEFELEAKNGYVEEVVDFIDCIENDRESEINPPESSLQSVEIALAEKKSVDSRDIVIL